MFAYRISYINVVSEIYIYRSMVSAVSEIWSCVKVEVAVLGSTP